MNFFKKFFENQFPKKTFFFKKKKNAFFQKIKFLYIGVKVFFLRKQFVFIKNQVSAKLSVCKNGDFWFCPTDTIVLRPPSPPHGRDSKILVLTSEKQNIRGFQFIVAHVEKAVYSPPTIIKTNRKEFS